MKKGSGLFNVSAYSVLTLVMTWPLALGLTRDVPGDLGDSLLNMWILGWGAENLPRLATGQIALRDFWNANIFHPEPLALSFSEHLFGQVLQILPVYYLTGNLILSYNLIFLSTFVLSGLGMYLLVRELLDGGRSFSWAAFVAGVIFAFVPFRIAQVAHIQSLSSHWMPFALYGFLRFIRTDNRRALAGGAAALLMQNWSCGYYLIYFAPFVLLFVLHQMFAARRMRDLRVWTWFAVAALVVAAGTWPFLTLYLEAQRVHGFERSLGEVIRFSADVYSYFTAPEALRLWGGTMNAYPKPEGELFFGLLPLLLIIAAFTRRGASFDSPSHAVSPERPTRTASSHPPPTDPPRLRIAANLLIVIAVLQFAGLIGIVMTGGFVTSIFGIPVRATNPLRLVSGIAIVLAILLVISADARRHLRTAARSPLTLAVGLTLLAMWLSLGPLPQVGGQALPGFGLYGVLYDHVPGYDGLRVPARYAMIAAVFVAVAAGFGAATLFQRVTRPAMLAFALTAAIVIEAAFAPMLVNQTWGDGEVAPPSRVEPAATAPPIYQQLAVMPNARVITEFPFGDPAWELRYVYYSTVHWKRLVNGYSGAFPQSYKVRVALFQRITENPDEAWQALRATGTTHVVIHEAAYRAGGSEPVKAWLSAHGARELERFGTDVMFEVNW